MQQSSTLERDREYTCTFQEGQDLGLVFSRVSETGSDIMVLCFSLTHNRTREGPRAHEGDRIMPGDVVFFVKGMTGELADSVSEEGVLLVPSGSGPLKMSFRRPAFGSIERDVGGRPRKKQAKFPGSKSHAGGAPSRKKHKNAMKAPWTSGQNSGPRGKKGRKESGGDAAEVISRIRTQRLSAGGLADTMKRVSEELEGERGYLP